MKRQPADVLTPAELAARWRHSVSERTLANWRASKPRRGPAFVKVGAAVLYRLADVIAFEKLNTVRPDGRPFQTVRQS